MFLRGLLILLAIASASQALAQSTLQVSRRDCQSLVEHRPSDDVTYRPGVDVRGRPVAPADLNGGSPLQLPERINIPITIDLAERYGFDDRGMGASTTLGTVSVRGGQAFWNGKPLNGGDQAAIAEACRKAGY
ncbi:hypothetical protein JCM17960_25160 [Magnetospira thiophila]